MNVYELLKAKRAEILRTTSKHGARNVRIIGSVARGEANSESDIDLLVDMDKGRSLMDHAALIIDLQELLGCKVDVASSRGLRDRIRDRVQKEATAL